MTIKVSVLEDDEPSRNALEILLNGTPGFRCTSTHASAEDALDNLPFTKTDVVLVDISLPGKSGIEFVAQAREAHPKLHLIMLTVFEDTERLFQSLMAGASGYILKRTPPAQILDSISEVANGGAPMSRSIAHKVIQYFHHLHGPAAEISKLTERELAILNQMAEGYQYKEIADRLGISFETVKSHIRSIYRKLQVSCRAEAINKLYGRSNKIHPTGAR